MGGNQHDRLSDDFCADWVAETKDGTNFLQKGGFGAMDKALDAGVVLVMSLWDDHAAQMLWLDSIYPVGSTTPGSARALVKPHQECQRMSSLSKQMPRLSSLTSRSAPFLLDPLLVHLLHPHTSVWEANVLLPLEELTRPLAKQCAAAA